MTQRGGGMIRHAITVGIVGWGLWFSSLMLEVRGAVAMQAHPWPGPLVWTIAEESNEILPCCGVGEDPESAKIWNSTPSEVSHEHAERVASANASQGHPAPPLEREKRTPAEEEAARDGFVLEPIHLLLLGSGLIGLGMLRNRQRKV